MSSSKLSNTLPHHNLVSFFKMTELLHFCNKIENCLHHLFLNLCSFDLPSALTGYFEHSSKNLPASFPSSQKCSKTKGTNFGAPPVNVIWFWYLTIFFCCMTVSSDALFTISLLNGWAIAMSRSKLTPLLMLNAVMSGLSSLFRYLPFGSVWRGTCNSLKSSLHPETIQ